MNGKRPTWAEIDLSAVEHNIRVVRQLVGKDVHIMAVVKADAYGHGSVEVSQSAMNAGAERLGVAILDEAVQLREAGIDAPIQILGCSLPNQAEDIVRYDIVQTISNQEILDELSHAAIKLQKKAKVHIKVDTGMGRVGVKSEDLIPFTLDVARRDGIEIEGIMTHFPSADETKDDFTSSQIDRFARLISARSVFSRIRYFHAANSAGIMRYRQSHFNLVRPGLMLYGATTVSDTPVKNLLKPSLRLMSKIVQIREMHKGESVSYGRTYTLPEDTRVGVIPIGYADGYSRSLSNRSSVIVNGRKMPLIGRVCMDQCLIDLGRETDVALGDSVTLIGNDGNQSVSVEELASWADTIPHEVLCTIGKRVDRVYINSDELSVQRLRA